MESNGNDPVNALSERKAKMQERIKALISKTSSAEKRVALQRELSEKEKIADRRLRLKELADDLVLLSENVDKDEQLKSEGDAEAEQRIAEASELREVILEEAVAEGLTREEIEEWVEGAPFYRRAEQASTEREIYEAAVAFKKAGVLKQISRVEFERIIGGNEVVRREQMKRLREEKHDPRLARSHTTPVFTVACSGDHRHFAPVGGKHRKLSEAILIMWGKANERVKAETREESEEIATDKTLEQLILDDQSGTAKASCRLRDRKPAGERGNNGVVPPSQRYTVYFRSNREELTVLRVDPERFNIPNLLEGCEKRDYFIDPDKERPNLTALPQHLRRFIFRCLEANGWRHPDWDYSRQNGGQGAKAGGDESIAIPVEQPLPNPVFSGAVIDEIMSGENGKGKRKKGKGAKEKGQYREEDAPQHAE